MHHSRFHIRSSTLAVAAAMLASAAHAQTAPAQQPAERPAPQAPQGQARPAPGGEKPGDVVVTGTRADVVGSPDRVSFNVANDLQVQTGTVADALRSVPGVEVDLQGNVSLRGDPGVKILINGRPSAMLSGENRGDVLLSMPAGQIERVEVITNPGAALSPEGSGGVINLVTRQARKDTTSGTVRATVGGKGRGALSLNGAHSAGPLTLSGDVALRRFTGDGRGVQERSRLNPATGDFIDSRLDTEIENTSTFGSARVSVDYDLDKKNRLSTEVSYRSARNEVERTDSFVSENAASSFERDSDINLANRGLNARASWRRTIAQEHELVADFEVETGKFRREVEAITDFAGAPNAFERIRNAGDRVEYSTKLDYKRPLGEGKSLNLGYQGNLARSEFDFTGARGPGFDALLPVAGLTNRFDYDQDVHALYGTYRFETGKLDAQIGLRLEQVEMDINQITDGVRVKRDYFRAYPTLHLGYDLAKTDQLRGSYSRRIQRPSPQDLNPYTIYIDPLNLRRGNPFLRPEITDSFELGWQHRKSGTFYSVTGFYRTSRGGVTDIISDIGGGVFLTTRENLATNERIGVELIANGKLAKTLSYNASATVQWNEIDPRENGISAPRSGTTGTVRGNLSWQPTPKDFFQLNAVYAGKQLLPQGYRKGSGILNLGYRRKVNDRLSLLVTAQDVLESARQVVFFETATLRDRLEQRGTGRTVLLGVTYNWGGEGARKRPEPGFEFQQGGGETPQ